MQSHSQARTGSRVPTDQGRKEKTKKYPPLRLDFRPCVLSGCIANHIFACLVPGFDAMIEIGDC